MLVLRPLGLLCLSRGQSAQGIYRQDANTHVCERLYILECICTYIQLYIYIYTHIMKAMPLYFTGHLNISVPSKAAEVTMQ